MGLFIAPAFLLLHLLLGSTAVLGLHYSVESGIDYQGWARSKDFSPGDTLWHNSKYIVSIASKKITQASEEEYKTCNISHPLHLDGMKDNVIKLLEAPKTLYFISSIRIQCDEGIRFLISVRAKNPAMAEVTKFPSNNYPYYGGNNNPYPYNNDYNNPNLNNNQNSKASHALNSIALLMLMVMSSTFGLGGILLNYF